MTYLAQDIRSARMAVERVLDGIGLRAYVYTVAPREHGWTLRLEYPVRHGWREATLAVDPGELRASLDDARVHRRLCSKWGRHLRAHPRSQ
ncbi:MAG: hypothetical protein HYY28_07845 [Betaproteobacteria bacterium]|nr:hypothetical protein [Betaproteobacteria bacterium]